VTTRARYRALGWFADHERDPLSVLLAKRPSTRMRNLMWREGQLKRITLGQFNLERWLLTDTGIEVLAGRAQRKERKGAADGRRERTGAAQNA
jgi:hypothetical protein